MSATGNVYFGNLTNQEEKEGRLNIVKSNLNRRVEELVEEDLRPLPTVLKRDKVCQSHDESLVHQLAEDLMASHRRSDTTKRAELLCTSSSESEHAVTTKRSSRATRTTEKHSRPQRTAKTDVSYSEEEPPEVVRQQRSKDANRTTRSDVSAHRSPAQLPLRIISPFQGETTRTQTRFERDLPETSTPQTEDRLYQGRLTRSRAPARTGRQRVSKYFEEQFQEESEQSLPANERRTEEDITIAKKDQTIITRNIAIRRVFRKREH